MGDNISFYQGQINNYNSKMNNLRWEINRYTNLYESLRTFKSIVEASRGDFDSVNQAKRRVLEDIEAVQANSKAALEYNIGICGVLDETGSRFVLAAYAGLIRQMANKLTEYMNEITRRNEQIRTCQQRIGELENKINKLRREERGGRKNGSGYRL